MISYLDLVPGKEYYIQAYDTQGYHKEMIFVEHERAVNDMASEYRVDLIMIFRKYPTDILRPYYSFYENDYYYDAEKIKENAQQAREQMECRSVNMILKRIVNEEFQWL